MTSSAEPARELPLSVLVVDPDAGRRRALCRALARKGLSAEEAADPDAARQRAPGFDLVVIDACMPADGCIKLAAALRRDSATAAAAILTLSASQLTVADQVRLLDAGADSHLCEPVDEQVLVATARSLARRGAAARAAAAMERDVARVQRTEAIGRLAGGVAHDVNNMLAVIIGYTEIIAKRLGDGHELSTELAEIRRAAEHSRSLARDLLAFGRQQVLERRPLAPGEVVQGLSHLLRHTIPEAIDLVIEDDSRGAVVLGDRAQLETVVVNLVANARDAMPDGGRLTLRATRLEPTEGAPAGRVGISVGDTGIGIPAEVLEKIFEPFFTTKELGHGTGLGLATVAGVVEQMGGEVSVESILGEGSTFAVTLPRERSGDGSGNGPDADGAGDDGPRHAGRTVLIVEDQAQVRGLVERLVTAAGYTVLGAASGSEALELLRDEGVSVDLLLTDMILPDLHGGDLVRRALEIQAGLRVVYTSGYAGESVTREGMPRGDGFLAKPYGSDDLRRALDAAFESDL
jgi:two-component system cell cycle sensor histidine kinase/response regulator CckA